MLSTRSGPTGKELGHARAQGHPTKGDFIAPIGREVLSEFDIILTPAEWHEGTKIRAARPKESTLIARGQNIDRGTFAESKGGKGHGKDGPTVAERFGKGPGAPPPQGGPGQVPLGYGPAPAASSTGGAAIPYPPAVQMPPASWGRPASGSYEPGHEDPWASAWADRVQERRGPGH